MNVIYRSIWNETTDTFVAVPELAKSGRISSASGAAAASTAAAETRFTVKNLVVCLFMAFTANAYALPTGGLVAAGSASISGGAGSMNVAQTSQNVAINWQSFNIGQTEAVRFVQPNSNSVALNRVLGADPSSILGSLSANGKVFLVNPNGILFGRGATVNVGGLLASTLNISDSAFMAGNYEFSGSSKGQVINQGLITTQGDGGYVALLGADVANNGTIVARLGSVALAAGTAMTLDVAGDGLLNVVVNQGAVNALVRNAGMIQADGGTVLLTAQSAGQLLQSMVSNSGIIQARSLENHNGTIRLLGDAAGTTVQVGGTLDASGSAAGQTGGVVKVLGQTVNLAGAEINVAGDAGGGSVLVGGNFNGAGPEQHASATTISADSRINADAISAGDGGRIAVWSDGDTAFAGSLSARGGANSGNGGFIETSGKHLSVADGAQVNTLAPHGVAGNWLLDPPDFTIGVGGDITGPALSATLVTTSVTIASGDGLVGINGDIHVDQPVTWTISGAPTTLTLNAVRDVNVNQAITTTGGSLASNAGRDVNLGAAVTATGGSITSTAVRDVNINGAVTTTDGAFSSIAGNNVNINAAALTTTRGNVLFRADNDGTGPGVAGGTVVFAAGTPAMAVTGPGSAVSIFYNPTSYATPTNYAPNFTLTGGATLTPFMWVFAQANNKVYDGNTTASMIFNGDPTLGGVVTLLPGVATFDTKNVGIGKTVTFAGFSLGGADAGKFALFSGAGTTTANITPLAIVGSITAADKVYDANTSATILTRSLAGAIAGDVVSYAGGTAVFGDKNVGVGKAVSGSGLALAGTDAGNYTVNTSAATTASITPLAILGSITAADKVYDANTSATIVTRSLTGAIAGDVVSYVGGSAVFGDKNVGVGKAVTGSGLALAGTDAGNYTVNAAAATTASITPLAILGSITAADKVYDGTTTASILTRGLTGVIAGDTVSYAGGTAVFSDKNVGVGKVVSGSSLALTGIDAGNYTVNTAAATTANIAPLALVGSITAADKVYDANTTATILLRGLVGAIAGDVVSYVGGTAVFGDKNVGVGKAVTGSGLALAGTDAGNYTVNPSAATTANITPLALVGSITAADKVYDANTSATILTRSLTGAIAGDTVSYTGGTAVFGDKNVGVGKAVTGSGLALAGTDAGNYTVNPSAATTANITPLALVGSITAADKVYDANTSATILTRSLTGAIAGDVVSYAGGTAVFGDKNVGVGKPVTGSGLALAGTDAGNYTVNPSAATTASITPLALVGSITAADKVYDANTSATILTRSVTGAIAGDAVSYTGGTAVFGDKNVGVGKAVTGSGLALAGADAGNYTVNAAAATTASITPLAIVGSITAADKVYDANTSATILTRSLTGAIAGDTVSYAGGTAVFGDKNVGVGKAVTGSGLALAGTDAGNYTVNPSAATTANITPLAITGSITAADKVYDATPAATIVTRSLTGAIPGDTVSYTGGTAVFNDKEIGNSKPVTGTGLALGGSDAGNYTVNPTAVTTASILPSGAPVIIVPVPVPPLVVPPIHLPVLTPVLPLVVEPPVMPSVLLAELPPQYQPAVPPVVVPVVVPPPAPVEIYRAPPPRKQDRN